MNRRRIHQQKGQVLVEYLIMLGLALAIVSIVYFSFRRTGLFLWQQMTCEVSAACPDCPADPTIRNRISPRACRN